MSMVNTAPGKISVRNLNFYYGKFHALKNINLDITKNQVTAFIGPSGCGKSTLLRTFNKMFERTREGNDFYHEMTDSNVIDKVSWPDERAAGKPSARCSDRSDQLKFRDEGRDVLLFVDNIYRYGRYGSIHCWAVCLQR